LLLPVVGGLSLLWFLLRVGPKPSRAAYPCQRAALPLAGAFLAWLAAVGVWMLARRQAMRLLAQSRYARAAACLAVAGGALLLAVQPFLESRLLAMNPVSHGVSGIARGVHPGRVVWVHAPEATDWAGPDSEQPWYEDACTDPEVVESMMSAGVRSLAGEPTDAAAWDALFRNFNEAKGRGGKGYAAGEKIAIKLNLVTCWTGQKSTPPFVDPVTREKTRFPQNIDVAPQMARALLQQLIEIVGVAESDISIGDTTALWPNCYLDPLRAAYPDVHYFENEGGEHRERAEFSDVPLYWSTPDAEGKVQDLIPTVFAEAAYVINFTTLKGHSSGITLCGKNLYGALIRLPNQQLRREGKLDYYHLHDSLPNQEWTPGTGHYRAIVDLLGHPDLGEKTVLNLVDGLYGGYFSDATPRRWKSAPFGDGETGDWPSSLFLSQDVVAIDSVGHDFLMAEWPDVVTGGVNAPGSLEGGQEDYLLEAAQADAPMSGTAYDPDGDGVPLKSLGVHDHWDGPSTKRYGRNLGSSEGIELVRVQLPEPAAELDISRTEGEYALSWDAGLGPCILEATPDLNRVDAWEPVQPVETAVMGRTGVRLDVGAEYRFFRLKRPAGDFGLK
jgi:hypothetical protein